MKFLLASKNKGKLAELNRILQPLGIEAVNEITAGITLPEVEETGSTFLENARLKAVSGMRASGMPTIADDSGLCVDALNGAPRIYSARFSDPGATDEKNIDKLLELMQNIPHDARTARFVSEICLIFPDGNEIDAYGAVEGYIGYERAGSGGFGYDPVFMVGERSFGEMSADEKDKISHRGRALKQLCEELKRLSDK